MNALRPLTGLAGPPAHAYGGGGGGGTSSPWDLPGAVGWEAASGAFEDPGGATPCADGTLLALLRGRTPATPDAAQADGAHQLTWVASSVGGRPALRGDGLGRWLTLAAPVVLPGEFAVYAVGRRAAGAGFQLASNAAGGSVLEVFSDDTAYCGVDGGAFVSAPYAGATGDVALCLRRYADDSVTVTATGQAGTTLGTLAGTLTLDTLCAQIPFGALRGDLSALLVLPAAVPGGAQAVVAAWALARYGLSLP